MDKIGRAANVYVSNFDIYTILRNEILDMTIPPGQLLSENAVAKRFEVSRTPIRTVFDWLRKDDLIEVHPRKGTFVSLLDLDMIDQIIYMRTMVEAGVMTKIAKERPPMVMEKLRANIKQQKYLIDSGITPKEFFEVDSAFHEQCMIAAKKQKLWQMIRHLDVHYSRYRMLDYTLTYRFEDLYEQHCQLFRYMETGQHAKIAGAIKVHLFSGFIYIGDRLTTEFKDYFSDGKRSIYEILTDLRATIDDIT